MERAVSTATKKLTFEEWQSLPETKQRYEIVDGVMIVPPGPNVDHQGIMLNVFEQLRGFVRGQGLGLVFAAPLDVLVQREPLRTRQPDVLYLNSERTGIRERADYRGMNFLEVPPDLVVEVLSPSNSRREIQSKLRDYRQVGVYECWLVSPEAETVEIIDLAGVDAATTAVFGVEDTLQSSLLPGFSLELQAVFS